MTNPSEGAKKSSQRRYWWSRNWFYTALIVIAIIGAFCAFYIPLHISEQFSAGDNVAALRQAILVATGGTIAMLTLWETRRKNLQEKDKNDLDHARQVKAERRSRYAKAIEQLADDKSAVRLGGIYTLVKLADEWLSDVKTIPSKGDRTDEAQIIINSLCAYIRSPFSLATKRAIFENSSTSISSAKNSKILMNKVFKAQQGKEEDKISLREEQETRRTIFEEIGKRIIEVQGFRIRKSGDTNIIGTSNDGLWHNLRYDFSNAPIFYPLNNLHFKSPNFEGAKFYGSANFSLSEFHGTPNFKNAEFMDEAYFRGTAFRKSAIFSGALFNKLALFESATFESVKGMSLNIGLEAYVKKGILSINRKFLEAAADFHDSEFREGCNFTSAFFDGPANFKKSSFCKSPTDSTARFTAAQFKDAVSFSESHFYQKANFTSTKFFNIADFADSIFEQESFFGGTIFLMLAIFKETKFIKYSPIFKGLIYKDKYIYLKNYKNYKQGRPLHAMFSKEPYIYYTTPSKYTQSGEIFISHNFNSSTQKPNKKIHMGITNYLGKDYPLPVDSVIFNPDPSNLTNGVPQSTSLPAK